MSLAAHLRRTFLTGIFAAIPIVATAAVIYYTDLYTRLLAPPIAGQRVPFLGLLVAALLVYLLGLFISTTLAKWALARLDTLLDSLPFLQHAYRAWKQVSLARGPSSMWDHVALVRLDQSPALTLAFTSAQPLDDHPDLLCVFIPSAPAPTSGRLVFVPRHLCQILSISPDEAFKHLLSGGNYLPDGIGAAAVPLLTPPPPASPASRPTSATDTPTPPLPPSPAPTPAP